MSRFDKKTVTIDKELVNWVEAMIRQKKFANFSHAVQKALYDLRQNMQEKD